MDEPPAQDDDAESFGDPVSAEEDIEPDEYEEDEASEDGAEPIEPDVEDTGLLDDNVPMQT